jgi:hypothetical protein
MVGHDDDPYDHQRQRDHLAHDARGGAVEFLVQPEAGQGNRDEGVTGGDDGQDRSEQSSLLEGILAEHEAHRADDRQGVDGPVGQQVDQPAALRGRDLDQKSRHSVVDAARQRQRQRPQVPAAPGHEQAAPHGHGQPHRERHHDVKADGRPSAGWPRDDEESAHADRAGHDPADQDRIPSPPQIRIDQHCEYQVAHEDRLHQRERPELQRHDLQAKADQRRGDGRVPQRLPHQVDQYSRRQRPPLLDPLRAALLRDRRHAEHHGGAEASHHGNQRGQPSARRV